MVERLPVSGKKETIYRRIAIEYNIYYLEGPMEGTGQGGWQGEGRDDMGCFLKGAGMGVQETLHRGEW